VPEVGIRELKANASKILDEVRKRGARYVVTRRGRPVGILLPIAEAQGGAPGLVAGEEAWRALEDLGKEISRDWPEGMTTGEILSAIRR
jgi:prevent-host-death family protein